MHLPYLHALDGIPFDSYVTMLEYAGIGVAMGNACDAAKAAADSVSYTHLTLPTTERV